MKTLQYNFDTIEVLNSFLASFLEINSECQPHLEGLTVYDLSEAHTTLCLNCISQWIVKHNVFLGYYENDADTLGYKLYCSASGQGTGFEDESNDPYAGILQAAAKELENIALHTDLFY